MSQASTFYAYAHQVGKSTLQGDTNPTEFSFDMVLTPDDLIKLYRRNEFVQIAVEWATIEAIRQGWIFTKIQQNISGMKFGKPFTFTDFDDYLNWIDFKAKIQKAITWARLFGSSIMLLLDDQKGEKTGENDVTLSANPNAIYSDCEPYHPLCNTSDGQCGYEVLDTDEDGHPSQYRITIFTKGMKTKRSYICPADRVVEFNAPQKEIKYGGSSRVEGIALIALAEEQTFKRLMKRAHDLAGGILTVEGVSSDEEAGAIDTALGDDLSCNDRLFLQAGRKVEYAVPQLSAAGEYSAVFDIFTRKLARHLRVSQQILDGAPQGDISSAKYNMITSYIEILAIQSHYHNAIEKCFHKLGKEDTRFTWVDVLPDQVNTPADLQINHTWSGSNAEQANNQLENKQPNDQGGQPDANSTD